MITAAQPGPVSRSRLGCVVLALFVWLTGCGDNSSSNSSSAGRVTFSVSGSVAYPQTLTDQGPLYVQLNGGSPLTPNTDGTFALNDLQDGDQWSVALATTPRFETCKFANGSKQMAGVINNANVQNLQIQCAPTQYSVSATVQGLPTATSIVLPAGKTFKDYTLVLHLTSQSTNFIGTGASSDTKLTITGNQATALTFPGSTIDDGSNFQISIEQPVSTNTEVCGNTEVAKNGSVSLQPLNCSIRNSSSLGRINGGSVTAEVDCVPVGRFVYAVAANEPINNIPQQGAVLPYMINSSTGQLTLIGSAAAATDIDPGELVVVQQHPPSDTSCPVSGSQSFAYVSNNELNGIAQYDISQFTIDDATGAIAALNPATVLFPSDPQKMKPPWKFAPAVDPTKDAIYVTEANGIYAYSYGIQSDGQLSPAVQYGGYNTSYNSMVFHGSNAYQVNEKGGPPYITQYSAASGGALTPAAGNKINVDSDQPLFLSFEPLGRFAYVLSYTSCTSEQTKTCPGTSPPGILAFQVGSNGNLVQIGSDMAVSQDNGVVGNSGTYAPIAYDRTGTYAFVLNQQATSVSVFQINQDGSLCSAVGSPFQPGYGVNPYNIVIDPSGRFVYILYAGTSTIAAYSINLTAYVPDLDLSTGCSATVSGDTPALAPIGVYPVTYFPGDSRMVIEQSGRYLYVGSYSNSPEGVIGYLAGQTGAVSGFFIDANTGALTPVVGSPFLTPAGMTFIYALALVP